MVYFVYLDSSCPITHFDSFKFQPRPPPGPPPRNGSAQRTRVGQVDLFLQQSNPTSQGRALPKYSLPDEAPTEEEDKSPFKKSLLEATFSVGRIMASLLLFKELKQFDRNGAFDRLLFDAEWSTVQPKFGILGRVVMGMLQGIPEQRILLH